jgi:hypothetical protein
MQKSLENPDKIASIHRKMIFYFEVIQILKRAWKVRKRIVE